MAPEYYLILLLVQRRRDLADDMAKARAQHVGEVVAKGTDALLDSAAATAEALHLPSEQLQTERRERAERRAQKASRKRRCALHH